MARNLKKNERRKIPLTRILQEVINELPESSEVLHNQSKKI